MKPNHTPIDEMDWDSNAKTAPSDTKDKFFDNWTEATLAQTHVGAGCCGRQERAPKRLCESRASDLSLSHSQAGHIKTLADLLAAQHLASKGAFAEDKLSDGPFQKFVGDDAEYLPKDSLRLQN